MTEAHVRAADAAEACAIAQTLLRAALPEGSQEGAAAAYDALVAAGDTASISAAGARLTQVVTRACTADANLDRKALLDQAAAVVGTRQRRHTLLLATGPIGNQMQNRPEAVLFEPKEHAVKVRMLTARLGVTLGSEKEPILHHEFFPFFLWITNRTKATQKGYAMVGSDHQQLVKRCARFVSSRAFSAVDRHVLMGVASTLADRPQAEPFRFMTMFGEDVAANLTDAGRALIQSAWQTVAKVVCFWEACEEQRIYPEVVIEQVMAFLTPFRYCADRPLPETLHKGTYRVAPPESESGSDSDDVPACADERRVASPAPKSPAKGPPCNWCGLRGHHQAICQRQLAGEPKLSKAARAKISKSASVGKSTPQRKPKK